MTYNIGYHSPGKLPWIFSGLVEKEQLGIRDIFTKAVYLWTGGVLPGSVAALTGYGFVRIAWYLAARGEKK